MGGARPAAKQGTKSSMTRLVVQMATKERLEDLVKKGHPDGTSLDILLGRMMDIYEERIACPRGNK